MSGDIFEIAFKVHTLGRCVIPSGGGAKHKGALVKWAPYQKQQSTEQEIKDWQEKYTPPLWAMITGTISKMFTIDCDSEESKEPMDSVGLKPHRRTPRGGYHYDCQLPDFRVKTMVGLFPHVDIRGEGGYANFIGRTPDGIYTILQYPTDSSLIPYERLPKKWQERIRTESLKSAVPVTAVGEDTTERISAESYIDGIGNRLLAQFIETAKAGTRNQRGFDLACQLRDNKVTQEDAPPIMLRYVIAVRDLPGRDGPYTKKEAMEPVAQTPPHR